jgi:N12 class adenine-specific DNA methylase
MYNSKEKFKENLEAIETSFKIQKEQRLPSPAELDTLKKYNGFGGLKVVLMPLEKPETWSAADRKLLPEVQQLHKILDEHTTPSAKKEFLNSIKSSILTAFYTDKRLVDGVAKTFYDKGIYFDKMLDPSAGAGQFIESFKTTDSQVNVVALEKDKLTAHILQGIYSGTNVEVKNTPFEDVGTSNNGRYDIATSNIPFGDFPAFDPNFVNSKDKAKQQSCRAIHNYFFVKALDQVREGGVVAFITSTGVSDSPTNEPIRRYLMNNANLVSVIRLPNNTFKENANTEVASDLIILQKNSGKNKLSQFEQDYIKSEKINDLNQNKTISLERVVYTSGSRGTDMYGKPAIVFEHKDGVVGISKDLSTKLGNDIDRYFSKELYNRNSQQRTETVTNSKPQQLSLFDVVQKNLFQSEKQETSPYIPRKGLDEKFITEGMLEIAPSGTVGIIQKTGAGWSIENKGFSRDKQEIAKSYINVRDSYLKLSDFEETLKIENPELRKELNQAYNHFRLKHGALNEGKNLSTILFDSYAREVLTLENSKDQKFVKADIFEKPVAFSKESKVESANDALIKSLNKFGNVDLNYITSILQKEEKSIKDDLKDLILFNPENSNYELRDKFLSGNIIEKIDSANNFLLKNPNHLPAQESLSELKKVIPERIPFEVLDFNLGERWIPNKYYSDFATKLFKVPTDVSFLKSSDSFHIEPKGFSSAIHIEHAVESNGRRYNGTYLLDHALKNTIPEFLIKDGETTRRDAQAIQLASTKIDKIRDGFIEYLRDLPDENKKDLEDIYNRKFNANVRPKNNGTHLELADLNLKNLGIESVYPSQKDTVWKIIQDDGGIADHDVGSGKTLIMCIAAHEMKRMGIKNKPLIIGMKANIGQIAETYKRAYPNDKLLYPGKDDFTPKNRENLLNSIKNNSWDCIILTHEQYKAIPQSLDIQKKILDKELDNIEKDLLLSKSSLKKADFKGLEKRKASLSSKIEEVNFTINSKKDNVLDFKKLGIDHIFIDESQNFKNLMFATRHTRVAGLGNQQGSQKATNLLFGIRTIQEQTGKDLGATFLSGTTISNSLSELYLLFKYLRPKHLEKQNIDTFDSWASVYAKKSVDFEFSVTNELIQKERFRNFIKVPELAKCYAEITDFRTAKQIGLDRPDLIEELIHTPQTPAQVDYSEKLKEFAKSGDATIIDRQPLSKSEEIAKMLIVTDLSKKMALDVRLVDPLAEDHPNSKLSNVAKKVKEFYDKSHEYKGTQLIFLDTSTYKKDEFNAYSELKKKFIEKGIPADEIKFVQDFNSQKQRDKLFEDVNEGKVRILFGSTQTLGTGVNVQKRVVAMHHVDIPWKPSETVQRNGRGQRTGNWAAKQFQDNKVYNFVYAVEQTLDNYKFCINKNKEVFINQIKECNLATRRIDEGGMDEKTGMSNLAEYIAITSGNTDLLEKAKMEKRIAVLEGEKYNFNADTAKARHKYSSTVLDIEKNERILEKLHKDEGQFNSKKKVDENGKIAPELNIEGITDTKKAGTEFVKQMKDVDSEDGKKIGSAYGFDIVIKTEKYINDKGDVEKINRCFIEGNYKYQHNHGQPSLKPENIVNYPAAALEKIPKMQDDYKMQLERAKELLPGLKTYTSSNFPKEGELSKLKEDLKLLEQKIAKDLQPQNLDVNKEKKEVEKGLSYSHRM